VRAINREQAMQRAGRFGQIMLVAAGAGLCGAAAPTRPLHDYFAVAISPDGTRVASVEGDETPSGEVDIFSIVIRAANDGTAYPVPLPCGAVAQCTPSAMDWSPDGKTLAFALRSPGSHDHAIYTVGPEGGTPHKLAAFNGTLVGLRYSPHGKLAVLATAGADKEVGAVEAGAAVVGELGGDVHEQRIAVLGADGAFQWASPPDLFVYEFDWRPDESGFVGTAAPGDGDDHWWVAKLYAFDAASAAGHVIYTPASARQQLAVPRVSPDGKTVSFIGGIMSDFGSTGGDAFVLPLDEANPQAVNVTPKLPATVTALAWSCDGKTLLASELAGDQRQLVSLPAQPGGPGHVLVSVPNDLGGSDDPVSISCATGQTAVVHSSFTVPAEIEAGQIGAWHDISHANAGLTAPAVVTSVTWKKDGFSDQGWLLQPLGAQSGEKQAMITEVHGGPAAANQPRFVGAGSVRRLLEAGYAIFLPNPRGSFGQGEAFTQANVRDFGHGDLRDILAGITAAEQVAPIDEHRLGIMGWSYGGYMTMWAVTQTNRFRAAVAGAGLSDWLSYYGENGIDGWMIPYFGASVYDDPAVYAKSSPMNFIKNVKTPTLTVVGERDIECPAPQTEEFWHALHDLGVPTVSVVYPGEGHWMHDPKHVQDFEDRLVAWFGKYLKK
jgi:dipeptidyl aminopeptidase/acylaminoacyl peptidase